jgi:hypothetical protein
VKIGESPRVARNEFPFPDGVIETQRARIAGANDFARGRFQHMTVPGRDRQAAEFTSLRWLDLRHRPRHPSQRGERIFSSDKRRRIHRKLRTLVPRFEFYAGGMLGIAG